MEAVAPTADKAGNVAYWYCSACSRYFTDRAATDELKFPEDIVVTAKLNGIVTDENGVMWYYENGVIVGNKGVVEINGEIYFVCYSGKIKQGNQTITEENCNGLLEPGLYYFRTTEDEKNGRGAAGTVLIRGVIEKEGELYFVCYSGKLKVDAYQTVTEENSNGLLEPGVYFFDEEGKLVK